MNSTLRITLSLTFIFFALGRIHGQSQEDTIRINAYYQEAITHYDDKEYSKALDYCERISEIYGKPQPEIELLKIKSYFYNNQITEARQTLDNFFLLENIDSALLEEVSPFIVRIEDAEIRILQKNKESEKAEREEKERQKQLELNNYLAAKTGDIQAIKSYLNTYPNGEYQEELSELLDQEEEKLYDKAISNTEMTYVEEYIRFFPNGKYINEINDKKNELKEYKIYQQTLSENTELAYENYLKEFADGIYKKDVEKIYAQLLYTKGNKLLTEKGYTAALNYFNTYKNRFPDGEDIENVNSQIKVAERGVRRQQNVGKRHNASTYLMATYNSNKAIGGELGGMNAYHRVDLFFGAEAKNPSPIFNKVEDEKIPDLKNLNKDSYEKVSISATLGLNVRIIYPVWVYLAAGVQESRILITEDHGNYEHDQVYLVENEKSTQFFPEFGVGGRVANRIMLKVGFRVLEGETIVKGGIGIGF